MDKLWLKQYPEGIPHTIDVQRLGTLVDVIERACSEFADKPAYSNMGVCFSYTQLDELSRNFASYLQNRLGLKKGDVLAIQLPNILQFPIVMFGALRAGLTVVNLNPLYTTPEIKSQLTDSGAKCIVVLTHFACHLEKALASTAIEHVIVTELADCLGWLQRTAVNFAVKYIKKMVPPYHLPNSIGFLKTLEDGQKSSYRKVAVHLDDLAFLQYTGGTTGVSKGAMLTHKNISANVVQIQTWVEKDLVAGAETVITALPLYHIFSLTVNCFTFLRLGGHSVLITNPKDIPGFVKTLSRTPFTVMTGVNTLFNALLNNEDFCKLNFSTLKATVAGGMALQKSVSDKWLEVTGHLIAEGYGLTETSPVVTCNPVNKNARIGTIGLPVPSTEIRLADDNGKEVPLGSAGELWVKGPQVMKGYWNNFAETGLVFQDGWLKTGDIATIDPDGYVRIVDRKKDMILVSGFNVYPNEVEDVLTQHPGILEAAVTAIEDPKSGEVVKAFIVKKDPALDQDSIIAFCKEQLAAYKIPRFIEFRTELPKTNVGKILRRALRDQQAS